MSDTTHFAPIDTFPRRHLGPSDADVVAMLEALGLESLDALADETIPPHISAQWRVLTIGNNHQIGKMGLCTMISFYR